MNVFLLLGANVVWTYKNEMREGQKECYGDGWKLEMWYELMVSIVSMSIFICTHMYICIYIFMYVYMPVFIP